MTEVETAEAVAAKLLGPPRYTVLGHRHEFHVVDWQRSQILITTSYQLVAETYAEKLNAGVNNGDA